MPDSRFAGLNEVCRAGSASSAALTWLAAALLLPLAGACAPTIPDRVPLHLLAREPLQAQPGERVDSLLFRDSADRPVVVFMRRPDRPPVEADGWPGVVLVAGRETGRRAAQVVPGPLEAVVLAVEYPAEVPTELEPGPLLDALPEIRRSAYRVPGVIVSAGRFLAAEPDVDPSRIALVGVSFGVPFAAPAARDTLFRGVALHHGGADLRLLLEANLPIESGLLRSLAARFGAWYLGALEPARYVGDISPRPLLLINGTRDELVPRESAERLAEAARPPLRHVWLPHDHLMPGDMHVMRELADSTLHHFEFLQSPGPVDSVPPSARR